MATNNLLVNNESKVLYEHSSKIERSAHNLSQSRKFPCEVGYLYPFFCRKTLPSDSFKISTNILIKQLQPFLVPQMVSFTVNTAFYWVDYSLAFPQFEYFLINQKGSQDIELPYVHLRTFEPTSSDSTALLPELSLSFSNRSGKSALPLSKNIRTFIDITKNRSNEKVDALPFWAYQTIKRDFYTNIDRLSDEEYSRLFPSDINKHFLKPGENTFYNDSVLDFDSIQVHDVRGDYFVNSYPTPLRGDIPSLNISADFEDLMGQFTAQITSSNFNPLDTNTKGIGLGAGVGGAVDNGLHPVSVKGPLSDSDRGNLYYNDGSNDFILTTKTNSNTNNVWTAINENFNKLKSGITYAGNMYLRNLANLDGAFSFTTQQLRLLESLTRKREIDILMKPRLKNYLGTYFGVRNYKDDSLYQPVFIGSTTQQILINDIAQTTSTDSSPLGRQGATAMSLGSGFVGDFYCRNYGCLMGIMYILPDFDYEPALPREWQERTPDEFVNPEFSHLSMQAILNKELFVSDDNEWNNEVLGYMGIYDNYRTSQNLVCGDLLNPNYSDIKLFAQVRRFNNQNRPEITTAFLDSKSAFDASVFSVPSMPPFIAQCVTRVEAVRPLPQLAIPRG